MNTRHIKCIVDHNLYGNTKEWNPILGGFSVSDLVPPTVETGALKVTINSEGEYSYAPQELTSITSELDVRPQMEDCRLVGDVARNCNILGPLTLGDLPKETYLRYTKLCGYIAPDGKYYHCDHCGHTTIVRDIALGEYLEEYKAVPAEFFDEKPNYMLQEEYFLMKKLGFAKISSFKLAVDKMYLFLYGTLTPEQTDIIYPR